MRLPLASATIDEWNPLRTPHDVARNKPRANIPMNRREQEKANPPMIRMTVTQICLADRVDTKIQKRREGVFSINEGGVLGARVSSLCVSPTHHPDEYM